jgi:hypothetical protein
MRLLLTFILLFLVSMPLMSAQQSGPGNTSRGVADIIFSEVEKHLIREYYDKHYGDDDDDKNKKKGHKGKNKKLPPGLAKKDELPPGLAKQLERNGTLPPGLAKRDLPSDLESRLPLLPKSHQRVIVDDDILLIERATGRILDILLGGARR